MWESIEAFVNSNPVFIIPFFMMFFVIMELCNYLLGTIEPLNKIFDPKER